MRLSNEQIEFRDLVRRVLSERVTSEYRRKRIASGSRSDPTLRDALRDLGLYQAFAGTEAPCSIIELALFAEECGRELVPDSCVEHVFVNSLLESLLDPLDRSNCFELVSAAEGRCALAYPSCCDFSIDQGGESVSGRATWAVCGDQASVLLGFAKTDSGLRSFLAKLSDSRAECSNASSCVSVSKQVSSLDLMTPLTEICLTKAPCTVIGLQSVETLVMAIEVIKASEVSGLCRRVIEITTEYVKTRSQFGAPIGSFQAIQQKLGQIYAESEALASLCRFAAWAFNNSPEQRRLTSRAAVLKAAELGVKVCETAIQCHGGIGFTWEYDLHLFLRRAQTVNSAFGLNEVRAHELIEATRCGA